MDKVLKLVLVRRFLRDPMSELSSTYSFTGSDPQSRTTRVKAMNAYDSLIR